MIKNIDRTILEKIYFLVGCQETIQEMICVPARKIFSKEVLEFLSSLSKRIIGDKKNRQYSDVMTFAFWIRRANLNNLKEKYGFCDNNIHMGRGVSFHIAPSNVPVNFAYSLVTGLLTGNANIVRVPTKAFPQVSIIETAINEVLKEYPDMRKYIALVRYERDKSINDVLSSVADTRIIWGGDDTVAEIRKSPISPRSNEISFSDRYSIAIINSEFYINMDKKAVALDFYNDTYLFDQNACTSPRIIIWTGSKKEEAKEVFWDSLHKILVEKYRFKSIQGINKMVSAFIVATKYEDILIRRCNDNLITRIQVNKVDSGLMNYMDNSGFFFELDCDNVMDLAELCNNVKCQTVGMIGDKEWILPLVRSGARGIDRIVSIGHTMDYDLIWDGYNLTSLLTRTIHI